MSDRVKMAQCLRDKAAQFRRLGEDYDTPLSSRIREVARDLEAQAESIERCADAAGGEPPDPGG
jgi:hypothetical protein